MPGAWLWIQTNYQRLYLFHSNTEWFWGHHMQHPFNVSHLYLRLEAV